MAKTRIMIKLSNGKYIDMSKAKNIKPEDKVHKVMREFKEGKLKSSSGQLVTSRDQAIAIAMSESGLSKNMIHDIAIEYDTMEKARPTKYIKRVPKPSGKGYYYFYTREQVKEFQEKGIVPKEEKGGNFWDKVKSFFGNNADEKVNKLHEIVSGAGISVTKDSLAEHLAEYLSNKEKWDAKLNKEKGEKKESAPKTEKPKSDKPSEKKEGGSKWNLSLMRKIAGIVGSEKKLPESREDYINPKDLEVRTNVNKKGIAQDILVDKRTGKDITPIVTETKKQEYLRYGYGNIDNKSLIKEESPDNFETMPEGVANSEERDKLKDKFSTYRDKEIYNNIELTINALPDKYTEEKKGLKKWLADLDTMVRKNNMDGATKLLHDITGTISGVKSGSETADKLYKELKENKKPSATEALKEIERTERFPDVPTYAEPPEGFKKVEGTTAPKGYEFYRNGSPLSKDYKQVLVKDKSKVEALKDELEKKDKEKEGGDEKGFKTLDKKDYPEKITTIISNKDYNYGRNGEPKDIEFNIDKKDIKSGFEKFGVKFFIAKDQYGYWKAYEAKTGKSLTQGQKTIKEAINKGVDILDKAGEKKLREALSLPIEKPEKMKTIKSGEEGDYPDRIEKVKEQSKKEVQQFQSEEYKKKSLKELKSIDKDFLTKDGKEELKKLIKQKEKIQKRWTTSDPQEIYDSLQYSIQETRNDLKDSLNYKNITDDGKFYDREDGEKFTFQEAIEDYFQIGGVDIYQKGWESKVDKNSVNEIKELKNKYDQILKDQKELSKIKEDLLGPKMFKALSNLRQEIMFKAQPTKYIKKIPNPNGKGYIYFYTQAQVKEYEKTGKLPDDQKKKPEVKESTGKGNIEILKESIKKVASIFADALSAKDAVQPTGQGVEQTGENIAQKSKDKKRLEKQRDIRKTTKKNTPEEKPTK